MKYSIDDVLVHASIAVNNRESGQSEEAKHLQVIADPNNDVYRAVSLIASPENLA
jgi:alkyl hydroperoxide reductase subunit AhpC